MTTSATSHVACLKMAADLGRMRALDEKGILKTAGILEGVLERGTSMWLPAGLGYIMGGPEHRLEGAIGGALGGHLGARALRKLSIRELRKVIKMQPSLSKYRGSTDRELLRGLQGDILFKKNPNLANMKEDFLPLLRQHEGVGSLTGGALGGFGVGKALSSQDALQDSEYVF